MITRGTVVIDVDACKGCDLCIDACPPGVLAMTDHEVNARGYRYPQLLAGCTGCRACSRSAPTSCSRSTSTRRPIERPRERRPVTCHRRSRDRRLLPGSEAIAEAMVAAGCRFFAGYPMTPFTEVLEHMARMLPAVGGVCMNAESELEAVGMAWGAAATGTPAATGSTGQGLSLMQESLAEITLARLPLVVLNMARAQGDYYQATRGGGHGDYRHIVLAPADAAEAVELVRLAFDLAERWRNPVLVMGDYYLAHTARSVAIPAAADPPVPEWALDGSSGGTGHAKLSPSWAPPSSATTSATTCRTTTRRVPATADMARAVEPLAEVEPGPTTPRWWWWPSARPAATCKRPCASCGRGVAVGFVRPITLVPVSHRSDRPRRPGGPGPWPSTRTTRARWSTTSAWPCSATRPVDFIGGLSLDSSGFGIAPDLDVAVARAGASASVVERSR